MSPKALLASRIAAVNQIEELAGVPAAHFQQYYLSPLHHYARFVQQLPASEAHHHAHSGGLLDHTLEVIATALSLRQGYLLPPGAEIEELVHRKDVWTYAIFAAALCHDLAKPAVDQKVSLYDGLGQAIGIWDSWCGDLDSNATAHWYGVEFVRHRTYRLHEKASLLLVHRIMPASGLTWLASDRQAFSAWCACVSGDIGQADVLGEIISLADRQSVAQNLGADTSPKAAKSQVVPLHDKLVMALRQLIEENILPLNRNGAAGWRSGNKLWLVSKRAVDSMRLYLTQSGHTGIPTENQRLFDVLQEHQVLEPYQDRAIWRMSVQGDNWAHDFTLICIPLIKVWQNPETWPDEFTGSVTSQLNGGEEPSQEQSDGIDQSDDLTIIDKTEKVVDLAQEGKNGNSFTTKPSTKPKTKRDKSKAQDMPSGKPSSTDNVGVQFLDWVVIGLQDRSLNYNNPGARVHVVAEGVLLVSPGIFKDFAKQHIDIKSWETVQKRLLKLGLHERSEGGLNVHKYMDFRKQQ
ncbi:MAG: DNA-binding domain-containing protein [Methyloglobulus sp.]|nr:DNA-binding domain-containing protein [Methyloglobulus sp.]